jgi:hypothetical protein
MLRVFSRPVPLLLALAFCTAIPILVSVVQVFQIPTGTYEDDSARLAVAPVTWFLHAAAGPIFGLIGPLQFVRALRGRFGRLHRISGRVFAVAGGVLGLSALGLLLQVPTKSAAPLELFRGLAGLGLLAALALSLAAIRVRNLQRHRAWAIRAYAIGMGSGTIALVYFPVYVITGQPPQGLGADLVFVGWWALNIAFAEWVIRTGRRQDARTLRTEPAPAT